ncbi:formate dehydrogenase [Nocardioides sp. GY 10113]|uniref:molybdopterin-containing oxidoreductase family protein n=1 Tax=Nocardioides sp. GY 10113 TaxID=2569761 RepID=UPI0010A88E7F|nr:molybdopterin-dependent oxidoreductase [Nocardioides sp. GY 10113]TIC88851.1 formate dehydrogenase [Nocardioides sp. GY 10113]
MSDSSRATQHPTFCRLCEPLCGLIATVQDGRLLGLAPDPDHPLSRGQVCPKGLAFTEVQNDEDRVLHPLRRRPDGAFERVSWDRALADIGSRLADVVAGHGGSSVGMYVGNPAGFNSELALWLGAFRGALGVPQIYTPGSQDSNSRMVANRLLYGALTQTPFPDLWRTDFLLVLGANPLVSHMSLVRVPRVREVLKDITGRGGRVVVVDPRRTETARAFEHVAVRPDADVWLLLSLLHVVLGEGLADEAAIAEQSSGIAFVRRAVADHPPERTEERTGVHAEQVRRLARDFAAAPSAVAYGRLGVCLGRHGTLANYLIDVLNLVTGNLDRAGGALFVRGVVPMEDLAERSGQASYGAARSRVGGFPDVLGTFPAAVIADEIVTPGTGQLRALFTLAGNPAHSTPDPDRLTAALPALDLHVAVDLYLNETSRYADYVLPATTFLEREDITVMLANAGQPFVQATPAVVAPYGEARPEWRVLDDVLRAAGLGPFAPGRAGRLVGRLGLTPRRVLDALVRIGPYGDRFGLRRGGLSARRVRSAPHGIVLADAPPTGLRTEVVRLPGHRVRLDAPEIVAELARLGDRHESDPAYPLRLIPLREMRSLNSWLHNSPTLMRGEARRHRARINPVDAAALGVEEGAGVRIRSRHGEIETVARVTDEVGPGTVAVPHGWGHAGGWRRANAAGGPNVNRLVAAEVGEVERLAGMAHLSGVPIAVEPLAAQPAGSVEAVGAANEVSAGPA